MKDLLSVLTVSELHVLARKLQLKGFSAPKTKDQKINFILTKVPSDKKIKKAIYSLYNSYYRGNLTIKNESGFEKIEPKLRQIENSKKTKLDRGIIATIITFLLSLLISYFISPKSNRNLSALHEKGRNSYEKKNYKKALGYFQEVEGVDPLFPNNSFFLGICFALLEDYESAYETFLKVPVKENHKMLQYNIANCLSHFDTKKANLEYKKGLSIYIESELEYWETYYGYLQTIENYDTFNLAFEKFLGLANFILSNNPHSIPEKIIVPKDAPIGTVLFRINRLTFGFKPYIKEKILGAYLINAKKSFDNKKYSEAIRTLVSTKNVNTRPLFSQSGEAFHLVIWNILHFYTIGKKSSKSYDRNEKTKHLILDYYQTLIDSNKTDNNYLVEASLLMQNLLHSSLGEYNYIKPLNFKKLRAKVTYTYKFDLNKNIKYVVSNKTNISTSGFTETIQMGSYYFNKSIITNSKEELDSILFYKAIFKSGDSIFTYDLFPNHIEIKSI